MNTRSKKGFTLVEIMIVVVIIGLLAAMAIPAFQKVRQSSLEKTVLNDARQIGAAAQQYMMENGASQVAITVTAGIVTGPLTDYLKQVSANAVVGGSPIVATVTASAFTITLPGAFGGTAAAFNAEGKKTN